MNDERIEPLQTIQEQLRHIAASDLQVLQDRALEIQLDETIGSQSRLIHLRATAADLKTRVNDAELKQLLSAARRQISGAAEPIAQGGKLKITETPWLWEGVIMQAATNLLVSLPKVGKSRLFTQMVGRLAKGHDAFLGRSLAPISPNVLIVGTDQPENDWAKCLDLAGLLADDGTMDDCIVGLFHKGCPLHLDEDGIDRIVSSYCEKYSNLVILIDSYSACTAALGLDERDATFANPLMDLQEAVHPSGSTLVVIHHSNRNAAGSRASQSSRGSTALPAAVSQTIAMSWADADSDNPLKPRDKRVKLTTEGRAGEPLEIFIEQVDEGRDWILHGTGDDLARQSKIEQIIESLTDRQYQSLKLMSQHWHAAKQGMDAVHLATALELEGSRPDTKAATVIQSLSRKHLVVDAGDRTACGGSGGKPAKLYRPADPILGLFQESAVIPFIPVIESVASGSDTEPMKGKKGMRGSIGMYKKESPCNWCGRLMTQQQKGRKRHYCSDSCRVSAHRKRKREAA